MNQLHFSHFPNGLRPEAELNRLEALRVKRVGQSPSAFCFKQFVSLKFPSSAVPGPMDTMQSALPHIR